MSYERDNIRRMAGYVYGEQPEGRDVIKLNTNENAWPPSPAPAEALVAFDVADLRRYPPATAAPLRRLVAERLGVDAKQVVATNGGDEALRLALTTFVAPGGTLGLASPSYSLMPVLAAVQDCTVADIALGCDWQLPNDCAARLNAAGAKLTCIVNPHAPSGSLMRAEAVAALARDLDGVLLVDEAYVDFVDPRHDHDLTPLVHEHDNVLLLRTLSKGYSLAGLRIGFLIGDVGLIEPILAKTRDSFNVDAIAQTLAAAAFADAAYAQSCWREIRRQRQRLAGQLGALGFQVPGSEANFLLARVPEGRSATRIQAGLRARRILVRHFPTSKLRDCLRITVGTPAESQALLDALGELL